MVLLLIKGVNHQIVEVSKPTCKYFERVIFFVKPEYSSVSDGTLRERASEIAGKADCPPPTRRIKNKIALVAGYTCCAIGGALVAIIVSKLI